jgi:hypothetical protein
MVLVLQEGITPGFPPSMAFPRAAVSRCVTYVRNSQVYYSSSSFFFLSMVAEKIYIKLEAHLSHA